MTTKGKLITGVVAVAILSAGGVAVVLFTERGAAGAQVRPSQALPAAVVQEAARLPPEPPPPVQPPAPSAEPVAPATAPELPTSLVDRARALEPLRQEVLAGITGMDGRVVACGLRGFGLVLTLETLDRRVRILEVAPRGAEESPDVSGGVAPPVPDEASLRCARGALVRSVFDAPSARPGRQWQMSYVAGVHQ